MAEVKTLTTVADGQFLTIEEASRELGIKPGVVRNYLYQNKLTTYKFKTLTLVSKDQVTAFKARRG